MLHPTIFNTSQLCHQLDIKHVVISPGSRNAPLIISFARHDKIRKWIIPDERSAAFIALGISQESNTSVALCCTSGTALLNYAPAIAEAFYREIPLVILSADRPSELIDQRDGQTIRQFEALKNHVKLSFKLPVVQNNIEASDYERLMIKAINLSKELPRGPVHVNIPFREPFYPSKKDRLLFKEVRIHKKINVINPSPSLLKKEQFDLSSFRRPLVLIGQNPYDKKLDILLSTLAKKLPIIRSPLNNLTSGIQHIDGFIDDQPELRPDLLITSGLSILSKNLKQFIRKNSPRKHLHFDESNVFIDTYKSNPKLVNYPLKDWLTIETLEHIDSKFVESWKHYECLTRDAISAFIHDAPFSEPKVIFQILASIPIHTNVHLSNSMPVRYANLFGVKEGIKCYSNRGTSGIDGCTSTAIGTSLISRKINTLITGDLAFLYDRNAFFHNYYTPNLRVIVLNNQGGGIFRLIKESSVLPELEDYFEVRHKKTAKYICRENELEYLTAKNEQELCSQLDNFYKTSTNAKILEVFIEPSINQKTYKKLINYINEQVSN